MNDISIGEMQQLQIRLQAAHKEWGELGPSQAKNQLLYLVEEVGEVISIIKKKNTVEIMENESVRANLCTELCDVLMYFNDVLLCYEITPAEIAKAYHVKSSHNIKRNYDAQNDELYTKMPV